MNRLILRSALLLFLIYVALFLLHSGFQIYADQELLKGLLLQSYTLNMSVVVVYILLFYYIFKSWKVPLGLYLFPSMFTKALIFFVVFQPIFKEDGKTTHWEFMVFFVPYIYALFFGVRILAQIIGSSET